MQSAMGRIGRLLVMAFVLAVPSAMADVTEYFHDNSFLVATGVFRTPEMSTCSAGGDLTVPPGGHGMICNPGSSFMTVWSCAIVGGHDVDCRPIGWLLPGEGMRIENTAQSAASLHIYLS